MKYPSVLISFIVVLLFISSSWSVASPAENQVDVLIDIVGLRESYRRGHGLSTIQSDGSEWFRDDGADDQLWAVEYLESLGVEILMVYGSSVLARVDQALVDTLRDAGRPTEIVEHRTRISIQSYRFDTRDGEPELPPGLRIEAVDPDEKAYFLVQFLWGVKESWSEEMEAYGLELLQYIPNNTHKVRGEGRHQDLLASLPFVEWVGFLHPAYKLSPRLGGLFGYLTLSVVLHSGEDFQFARSQIEVAGGEVVRGSGEYLIVRAPHTAIPSLARISAVETIGPWEGIVYPRLRDIPTGATFSFLPLHLFIPAFIVLLSVILGLRRGPPRRRDVQRVRAV